MTRGHHERRLTREKIGARLKLIAPLVFRKSVPVEPFRILPLEAAVLDAPICADPSGWDVVEPGSYWGSADLNFVMKSGFAVPEGWNVNRLALHLPLGVLGDIFNHPEALAYVDQVPIGSADRHHHVLPLSAELADGRRHVLSLHGWTGHAGWPPDPNSSAKLHMGDCALVEVDPTTRDFFRLAGVAYDALNVLDDPEIVQGLLDALDAGFLALDTRDPIGDAFYDSVPAAFDTLRSGLQSAGSPLDVTLHGIGHAHMDIAYLWPISQIRLKNARTYSNVLRLMEDHADYRFSHSQPALYEMTAKDYPQLFQGIKSRVADGTWEVMGGMWVEPDLNVAGSEALIRQLVLGRQYFRETFGDVETPVLWLPDTFGFPGQIPQLMALAGLEWFVTNKLNWNQFNRVPWATHVWEGIDGTRVKAHVLTTPREVQYLPFPTNYKSDLSAAEVMGTWTHAGAGAARDLPICFGYGDGGGGPTEELLDRAQTFADFPGMPRFKMTTVRDALAALETSSGDLPIWRGEHYLEGHRGVYTSQGWIKRANRKAEQALHLAEAMAAMAGKTCDLTEAWKLLCLNQFHDIVTGTSVPEVYEDARLDYARIASIAKEVTDQAKGALAGPKPVVVSVLPTKGARCITVPTSAREHGQVTDEGTLLFFEDLRPYSITPVDTARQPARPVRVTSDGASVKLENAFLTAVFKNGELVSLVEAETGREVIKPGCIGNRLLAFEDRPIAWDAWDIDPHYEDHEEALGPPVSVVVVEDGPIRAKLRLEFTWRDSSIVQHVTLCADSRRLDFETTVDWHQSHTLLKVAFPVSVIASEAMFDIQWGCIARSTGRTSDFDAARFEVPAQKWVSLSDDGLEVALMNDCKYGYDVREDVLRLTLIKSATSPDPKADQGHHQFTYGLYAAPPGQIALRNHAAYDLNSQAMVVETGEGELVHEGRARFAVDAENVLIETLKPCATTSGVVVRLFECSGRKTQCRLTADRPIKSAEKSDIFEVPIGALPTELNSVALTLAPFQIMTLRLVV